MGRIPIDEQFARDVREAVRDACSAVRVHVYHRQGAEERIEQAAKEAIVAVFQAEFPNSLKPFMVRRDWPYAECWIVEDEAIVRYSFSPETDRLMGGIAFEPIRIPVERAPPGLMARIWKGLRAKRESEPAPDGRPEMMLDEPVEDTPQTRQPAYSKPAKPMPPGMTPRTRR